MTWLQLVLVFLASSLIGIESVLDGFQLHRPIVACTLIGLILGDVKTGVIIGGTLEISSLGWMNVGAAISPDTALASIVSTIVVILGKQNMGAGIALALPVAATGQLLTILTRSLTIGFQHFADKIIKKKNNTTYITLIHISALILQAMRVAIPALLTSISMESSLVKNILNSLPIFITNGLNIASGIIVVVGYAMIINMMQTGGILITFFFLGFVISNSQSFNLIELSIIALVIAIVYIKLLYKNNSNDITNKKENTVIKDDELD